MSDDFTHELWLRQQLIELGVITPADPGPYLMTREQIKRYRDALIAKGILKPKTYAVRPPEGRLRIVM